VGALVRQELRSLCGVLAGAVAMCVLGAVDDIYGVRATHKLIIQTAVAVVAYSLGIRIDSIHLPWIGELSMGVFALPITVLWITGIVNSVNLIDGLDGLAAGVVFFAALSTLTTALLMDSTVVALLMSALLGSLIGFLVYNFNPATIFMGDSGSYFLGYLIATSSLIGATQKTSTAVSLLVPIVALGVPIVDTLLAIVRRVLARRPVFSPDRGHLHHRLLELGITHRRAVLTIYGICVVSTVSAITLAVGRSWQAGIALVGSTVVVFGFVRSVGYLEDVRRVRLHRVDRDEADVQRIRAAMPTFLEAVGTARVEDEIWTAVSELQKCAGLQYWQLSSSLDDGESVFVRGSDRTGESQQATTTLDVILAGSQPVIRTLSFGMSDNGGEGPRRVEAMLLVAVDWLELAVRRCEVPSRATASEVVEARFEVQESTEPRIPEAAMSSKA